MLVIGGCAQSTSPTAILPTAWKNPAIGSEFQLQQSFFDSSSYGYIDSGTTISLYQVTDSNLTIGGKHHVHRLVYSGSSGSLFTVTEANGDFSIGDSTYNPNTYEPYIEWTTFPTTSGGTLNDRPVDSVADY